MGKSPSAPNPYATASAQGQVNADTARTNARLNRGNTFSPFGTVTNRDMGEEWLAPRREQAMRDNAGDPNFNINQWAESANQGNPMRDQWETTTTLSPAMQRTFDVAQRNQFDAVNRPMQYDDADARDRATAGIMSRLQPQFERDRAALESRLLSQGFTVGSEGYARAADELNRTQTDANLQAVQAGLAESRNSAGFNNQVRGMQMQDLGSLFGMGTPQQAQLAQVGMDSPDLQGAIYANYNARQQANQAMNANIFGLLGAGAQAGGMAYGRSDRRLKRDVVQIGEHETGLPIYLFRYIDTGEQAIGFMADEVAAIRPDAVRIRPDGYAEVNYGAF
jgi:hypothetical protein